MLIRTISGIHAPDQGEILWEGVPQRIRTPREAADLGIETVYQDLALADNLDIVQNMFLGRERTRVGLLDEEAMETSAGETLASLSVTTVRSVRQPVASLSGGQRQAVAIAKAVLWNSRLVIMDEPTAALGVSQTKMVLELTRRLAERGLGVLIISHNLNDVFEVADRIAVLYLGRLVVQGAIDDFDRDTVVALHHVGHRRRRAIGPLAIGKGRPMTTPIDDTERPDAAGAGAVGGADVDVDVDADADARRSMPSRRSRVRR